MYGQYLKSRFRPGIYVPCAAFLVTAGIAGGRTISVPEVIASLLTALALLLQFRIWDDIADVDRDRSKHPDRVMVRAASLAPFIRLTVAVFATNLVLLAAQPGPAPRLPVFLLLNLALLLWYMKLRSVLRNRVVGYHVVLLKYPAIVYLLSGEGGATWFLVLTMVLVFLCFAVYEALHDGDRNTDTRVIRTRRLEAAGLLLVALPMAMLLATNSNSAAALQAAAGVLGFLVLGELFDRRGLHLQSPGASYCVFAIGLLLVGNLALRGQ